jgi:hypothetical protein
MYAKDMDEEEAAEWLDGVLLGGPSVSTNGGRKKTTTAKPAKVASKTAAKPKTATARKKTTAAKPAVKAKSSTKARATSR